MNAGARLAAAAENYVGVPFQLHGRDPAFGLDCVGLVAVSLEAIGYKVIAPRGYRLRNSSIAIWMELAPQNGFYAVNGPIRTGDVLLTAPGPAQSHLMIACDGSRAVHAHAGLRRVVDQPLDANLRLVAHWRLKSRNKDL